MMDNEDGTVKRHITNLMRNTKNAETRLYRQGIDNWDEAKLEQRANYSSLKKAIILQRLREVREQNSSDDE